MDNHHVGKKVVCVERNSDFAQVEQISSLPETAFLTVNQFNKNHQGYDHATIALDKEAALLLVKELNHALRLNLHQQTPAGSFEPLC